MRKLFRFLIVLVIVVLLSPYAFYLNKPVHVSIDDVTVLARLSDKCDYNDIFEDPFLKWIRNYHNSTGAKFTLYVYENTVKDVSDKYWAQIRNSSDWLKIGYHSMSEEQPESRSSEEFMTSYCRLDSTLSKHALENKASVIRLHYWKALPNEVIFMKDRGVKCLLAADRETISYSLSPDDIQRLEDKESIEKDGMVYKKTDFRVENTKLFKALVKNATDEELVVFTHEWAMEEGSAMLQKFGLLLSFLHIYGSDFVY